MGTMAAKKPITSRFKMPEEHRVKIANSNILNALIEHAEGKREMSATQVTAGLGLLKKALPDLSTVDFTGTVEHTVSDPVIALFERIAGVGKRLAVNDSND